MFQYSLKLCSETCLIVGRIEGDMIIHFDVLPTVHLRIILVIDQLNTQILVL